MRIKNSLFLKRKEKLSEYVFVLLPLFNKKNKKIPFVLKLYFLIILTLDPNSSEKNIFFTVSATKKTVKGAVIVQFMC